ncbi:hypothetical protein ABKA04_006931 [Annulohypoxylon sp. FPYF3050]
METSKISHPKIAIIGAGIGGLALAIGLIKRNIPVTVYDAADQFSTVGAGIGLGPNALNAMDLVDNVFRERYDEVKTQNEKSEFEHSIFDALYAEEGFGEKRGWTRGLVGAPYFTRSSAHRKDLLEIMESFIPEGSVKFKKRALSFEQVEKKVYIKFEDGTSETVDAVIGCDGVKGLTRRAVLGEIAPEEVQPTFMGMYIYRGIIPMTQAKEILGTHAGDAKFFMAKGKAVAAYPISRGQEMNLVFFVTDDKPWTQGDHAIPCTKEEMVGDLEGRICLLGDVAHASSSHQAAGAGQGLEDAAVLSHLLTLVRTPEDLETAFQVYDAIRRPRAQKVVSTSHEAGLIYTWQDPEIGDNMKAIKDNANQRLHWIWQHDLKADIQKAEDDFHRLRRR